MIKEVTLYVLLSDILSNCLNVGTITIVSDVLKYNITSFFLLCSLESRDNPFIPGGSLDQEAADILKRATIIRDQFILSDNEDENSAVDIKENNSDENNTCQDSKADITEETILPQSVNSTQALPETKQNGKLEEKTISNDSPPVDNNQKDGTLDASLKDKKKQKKCCSLM